MKRLAAIVMGTHPEVEGGSNLLVNSRRRKNFGQSLANICAALVQLSNTRLGLPILLPVHLNPNVRAVVRERLGGRPRITLAQLMDKADFVAPTDQSNVILSDNGGVQEKAPALDTPRPVMRDSSERPAAIDVGAARPVGRDFDCIAAGVSELVDDAGLYAAMAPAPDPFGDGTAKRWIVDILERAA